ncbi:Transcriptional activator NphR [compost metagenome]
MEYVMQYRLEQARLLLLKTDWSMARIAEEVGFVYASYFSRCFTARNGITPLQYRKQYSQ